MGPRKTKGEGTRGDVLQAFVYGEVAVLVRHWFEIDLGDSHLEHGARIEVRLLDPQSHRGSESAAQRIAVDQPVWRADLFDRVDSAPGRFDAAHFHPHFVGVEPSERHWADVVTDQPWQWLEEQLSHVADIAAGAGVRLRRPDEESGEVRADVPAIVAAAQGRAATRCTSREQCFAWTRDVATAVRLMLEELARPDLLDEDRVAPWRTASTRN